MTVGIIEHKHIMNLVSQGSRLDGRGLDEPRELSIETDVINKADGSAKVVKGNTMVYAGIKAELGTPFSDTPNSGVLIVNIEMNPIASPYFESGPPSKDAIEMSRVCDRGIREARVIDVDQLCVVPGEKVWMIFVDIYPLSDDGNLLDASSIAAMAALATAKLKVLKTNNDGKTEFTDETKPLPITKFSTSVTFSKIGNQLIVDPTLDEEKVEEGRFTVGVMEDGTISALQKSLPVGFTKEEIFSMLDKAKGIGLAQLQDMKSKIS